MHNQPWPQYDPAALIEDEIEVPVQVNGKLRGTVKVPADANQDVALAAALELKSVHDALRGGEPKRVIFVPGRALNLVV